jgi:hypothetical protein
MFVSPTYQEFKINFYTFVGHKKVLGTSWNGESIMCAFSFRFALWKETLQGRVPIPLYFRGSRTINYTHNFKICTFDFLVRTISPCDDSPASLSALIGSLQRVRCVIEDGAVHDNSCDESPGSLSAMVGRVQDGAASDNLAGTSAETISR